MRCLLCRRRRCLLARLVILLGCRSAVMRRRTGCWRVCGGGAIAATAAAMAAASAHIVYKIARRHARLR